MRSKRSSRANPRSPCRQSLCRVKPTAFPRRTGQMRAARHLTGPHRRRLIPRAGHFLPREAPEAVVQAIGEL